MIKRDYYDCLGVASSATREEIRKAYRRLAHQFHPDKNPDNPAAEEHFKLITEAYEVLQDTEKRSAYDRSGPFNGRSGFEGYRQPPRESYGRDFFGDVFEEFFEDFLGAVRSRRTRTRGADLRYRLEISLEEAAFGSEKKIEFSRKSVCPLCRGSRCAPGTARILCPACDGHGSLRSRRGFFEVATACERCRGEGEIIPRPCPRCGGEGSLKAHLAFKINTPPGADEGTRLRMAGEGEMGTGGAPPGDLYIVISVKNHPVFHRAGNDLFCEVPVTLDQAIRGADLVVSTLHGKVRMRVPARTPSEKVLTLKGLGMPILERKGRGDLKVRIRVEIPRRPSKKDRQVLEEFYRLSKEGKDSEEEASFRAVVN
jgi:molecular chaperone DnaJ